MTTEAESQTKKFVTLSGELAERMVRLAETEHRSFANMVEVLVSEAMDTRKAEQEGAA